MKALIKISVSIFAVVIFTSCENVVQIKLDEGSKLLVIDAFVNDMRSDQKVRLTYTDSYFSGKNPPPVTNGVVILKDITASKNYTFTNVGNGDYTYSITVSDTIAIVGHEYELNVLYDGKTYTSYCKQKRSTVIDSISHVFRKKSSFVEEGWYCKFWAFDPEGPEPDYYWVKAFRNGIMFNKGSEINLAFDGAYSAGADGFIFIPPIAEAITPFGEFYEFNDVCRVEIHSISKEAYFFLYQVQQQTTNSGLFATTPENVRTNINTPEGSTKAIGWFQMSGVGALQKTIN